MPKFISKIAPYLTERSMLGKYAIEDLSKSLTSLRVSNRQVALNLLEKEHEFTPSEISDFLSYYLEKLISFQPIKQDSKGDNPKENDFKKAKRYMSVFSDLLNDFQINKAVLLSVCCMDFKTEEEIEQVLKLLRNLKIEKKSPEAFELVCKYTKDRLWLTGDHSAKGSDKILCRIEVVANYFEIDLKDFKGCFEDLAIDFEKHHYHRRSFAIRKFVKKLFKKAS